MISSFLFLLFAKGSSFSFFLSSPSSLQPSYPSAFCFLYKLLDFTPFFVVFVHPSSPSPLFHWIPQHSTRSPGSSTHVTVFLSIIETYSQMTSTPVNNAQAPDYSYQPSPSPTESISTLPSPSQEMFSPVAFDDPQQPMIPSSQLQLQPPSPSPSPSPHPPSTATVLPPSPPPHQLESNSTNVIPLRKTEVWAWVKTTLTFFCFC